MAYGEPEAESVPVLSSSLSPTMAKPDIDVVNVTVPVAPDAAVRKSV
jgi:hypothetical protein